MTKHVPPGLPSAQIMEFAGRSHRRMTASNSINSGNEKLLNNLAFRS
jgi:hypothetical protein